VEKGEGKELRESAELREKGGEIKNLVALST